MSMVKMSAWVLPGDQPSKTMPWLSGAQRGVPPLRVRVSKPQAEPSLSHIQIACSPERIEESAMWRPSGEICGLSSTWLVPMKGGDGAPGFRGSSRKMFVS